jgi:phosphoserine phosphatase
LGDIGGDAEAVALEQQTFESFVRAAMKGSGRKVVVFDADGTLWQGDLGERHLLDVGESGLVSPEAGSHSAHQRYMDACAQDVERGYRLGTQLLEGLEEAQVYESCERTWNAYKPLLFSYVRPTFSLLQELGAEIWVVSASHRWVIEVAIRDLGVPSDQIIAGDLDVVGGCLTSCVVEPFPNGEGKAHAISERIQIAPRMAFGNSRHDSPMLKCSEKGVFVWDATSYHTAWIADATEESWFIHEARIS